MVVRFEVAHPLLSTPAADNLVVGRFSQAGLDDAQLVRDVVRGDHQALDVVWDRYSGLVRSVLFGALGCDSSIEDLRQDVFMAFFRGAAQVREGAALKGYLVGIAVRLAALELRRRKVRRWVGLSVSGELPELPVAPQDSEGREALTALYRVLDGLSSRRRLAFVLRHVQGMEILEVALALEISESTARRELSKAQQQLTALARREPALASWWRVLAHHE